MNFQKIPRIESYQKMLDMAFSSARLRAKVLFQASRLKNPEAKKRTAESLRMLTAKDVLSKHLKKTISSFPVIDNLPPFYAELAKNNIDFDEYKKCISNIRWGASQVESIYASARKQFAGATTANEVIKIRNAFYARSGSVLKKISGPLENLEKARKELRKLPDIKDDAYIVVIAGYPNVGKSSLLKMLTSANAKIASYPFTTTRINVGSIETDGRIIQLLDVPGAFDRDSISKTENIAHLAIKHLSQVVLFVLDPTLSSGYSIEDQLSLLETLKSFGKEMVIVESKCDLSAHEKFSGQGFRVSTQTYEGIEELKDFLINKTK